MAEIEKPELRDPVAQDAKLVGDDEISENNEFSVEPAVNTDPVDAQVAQPREADDDKVNVHETVIATDEKILDPADPRAVQVPDAGRGSLDLPAHRLAAPTVEDVFAEQASEVKEVSADERKDATARGVSVPQVEEKKDEPEAPAEPSN